MTQLPVIVGFGGYNAAGRSSFHHGFRRMIIESLSGDTRQETLAGLGVSVAFVCMLKLNADWFHEGRFATMIGVGGMLIEDQAREAKQQRAEKSTSVLDRAGIEAKLRVALHTRSSSETLIIGRTDAYGVHGLDEAMTRARRTFITVWPTRL